MYPCNSEKNSAVNVVNENIDIENVISSNVIEQPSRSCAVKRPYIDIKYESFAKIPCLKRIDLRQDPDVIGSHLIKETDSIPFVAVNSKVEIKSEDFNEEIARASDVNNTEQACTIPFVAVNPKVEIKSEDSNEEITIATNINNTEQACTIPFVVVNPKVEIKSEDSNEEIATATDINNTEQADYMSLVVTSPEIEIEIEDCRNETFTEEIATATDTNNTEQTAQQRRSASELHTFYKNEQCTIKKELILKSYHRSSMLYLESNTSIYKDAIRRIDIIDSKGSFINSVLEEIHNFAGDKGFEKSSVDLSATYSNMCGYILNKVSPCIDDVMFNADVLITPGMSISNIKYNCVLNHLFFEKLRENCENIIQDIRTDSDNSLLNVFQNCVSLNYCSGVTSIRPKFFISSKNRSMFCSKLKDLIIEAIYNLPRSIIWEIENFDQCDIINGLFSDVHGVLVSKSSIKGLKYFFDSTKNEISGSKFSDSFVNGLLEKIENLVRKSYIFYEGEVFLPNESIVENLSRYLLSDMYGISTKFSEKVKLSSKNISELQESNTFSNVGIQLPKLYLSATGVITVGNAIKISNQDSDCKTLKQSATSNVFKLRRYRHLNSMWYKKFAGFAGNIYENAIKKMDIDSKGLFKNSVLEEMDNSIKNRGLSRLSIVLSPTYSNVRRYILEKISPCINNIMAIEDILITAGMSISEIRSNCISNCNFFKKLHENCEKITENIRIMPDDILLNLIQPDIHFGSDWRVSIVHRRRKLCRKMKELIVETISNLPQSIVFELSKFEQSDIINGLFSDIHGTLIPKSLIRNIRSFLDYEKKKFSNDNFRDNIVSFNNLLSRLGGMVKTSVMFHEGKLVLPDKYTVEVLSKYLLMDAYDIPFKFYKKLKLSAKNVSDINESSDVINFESFNILSDSDANVRTQLLKNEERISKSNYSWNPNFITSLNIYESSISMIDIDTSKFEDYFLYKLKLISTTVKNLNNKSKIKLDLSIVHGRVKNYILEVFIPFLKKNEKEIKAKIGLYHGMSLDELEFAYISNERFFTKLSSFCDEFISYIKNRGDSTLAGMVPSYMHLEVEASLPKITRKIQLGRHKCRFNECMLNLLVENVSSISERIVTAIRSLPRSKLVEEYFSVFHDIYVDNESLLKAKLVFTATQQKIMNDKLLSKLVDKISSDMFCEFGVDVPKNLYKFINGYTVCKKISTANYIRKLVRDEFPTLRNNLADSIMIIRHDKIEMADQKIRCEILGRLESDLITAAISLYRKLCVNQCKSKNKE